MFTQNIFEIVWAVMWLMLLATCVFALWKGGTPERVGALLLIIVTLVAALIEAIFQQPARGIAHLFNDAVLALGFLVVALRYASFWLGGAMLLQAVQFSLHSYYFVTTRPRDTIYIIVNNLDTFGILALLAIGTAVSWRSRMRARASALH